MGAELRDASDGLLAAAVAQRHCIALDEIFRRREARPRWVLDTNEVAGDDGRRRPDLARRTDAAVRLARLRAERVAVAAVAPVAEARLRVRNAQLQLERVAQPKPAHALGRR